MIVLVVLYLLLQVARALRLAAPSGSYSISTTPRQFTDTSRHDPIALQFYNITTPRKLMTSIFYPQNNTKPACHTSYMPRKTAAFINAEYELAPGSLEKLTLPIACPSDKRHSRSSNPNDLKFPLLIFSPAFGTSRLMYSSLASEIASYGFVVVTIDHPGDVDIVEFPDNSTIISPFLSVTDEAGLIAFTNEAQNTRVADVSYVLDQLSLPSTLQSLGLPCALKTSKVGIFGHSLGGSSALIAIQNDTRFEGAINMDGYIFGPPPYYVPTEGTNKPFLLFGGEGDNRTCCGESGFVSSWGAFWNASNGYKLELELKEAQHYDFSDVPLILRTLQHNESSNLQAIFPLGTIDGLRVRGLVSAYVVAFFEKIFQEKDQPLLDKPSKKYPEVSFV
ncbi:hypothetical protein BP5796_01751 [Coleophoma crateriformis]|uniref:1-alkyl-2-acetylglycerophosphocholine esterase n=1 Tax=Coleophoma crateriformis TaxID=565419 RepID=A0A3D8T1A3_9HELO|nr:hypothetical protein BP5796_01751 [Coleophoma crateriformis]